MPFDFLFVDHGSVCILTPLSESAGEWVEAHIAADAQTFGPGVVIEPRYVDPILAGITDDGLTIGG